MLNRSPNREHSLGFSQITSSRVEEAAELWDSLHLGELLNDVKQQQMHTAYRKPVPDPMYQQKKILESSSFKVLLDRYQSKPIKPKMLAKSTLNRLADPCRGKYSPERKPKKVKPKIEETPKRFMRSSTPPAPTPSPKKEGTFFLTEAGDTTPQKPPALPNIDDKKPSRMRRQLQQAKEQDKIFKQSNNRSNNRSAATKIKSTRIASKPNQPRRSQRKNLPVPLKTRPLKTDAMPRNRAPRKSAPVAGLQVSKRQSKPLASASGPLPKREIKPAMSRSTPALAMAEKRINAVQDRLKRSAKAGQAPPVAPPPKKNAIINDKFKSKPVPVKQRMERNVAARVDRARQLLSRLPSSERNKPIEVRSKPPPVKSEPIIEKMDTKLVDASLLNTFQRINKYQSQAPSKKVPLSSAANIDDDNLSQLFAAHANRISTHLATITDHSSKYRQLKEFDGKRLQYTDSNDNYSNVLERKTEEKAVETPKSIVI